MGNTSNKFYGEVGYAPTTTNDNGVATASIVKRNYYGNVLKLISKWHATDHLNDDVQVSHRISIIADPYSLENFPYIKYVEWMGTKWEVTSTEVAFPRIILSLGGVYNGVST